MPQDINAQKRPEMYPVMLTPFTGSGEVDYPALEALIDFYESNGVDGLFSICQSSEIFYLSLRERVEIASFVKRHAHVPVVASGHVSWGINDQIDELRRVADTGVDAVILITNRLAGPKDAPDEWMKSLDAIMSALPDNMPLGFYECPMPYKRLISDAELKYAADTGRFRFMKDTCCDMGTILRRLEILRGTKMGLYNANTATLLPSLRAGAAGYSGIMANFHPELYAWLLRHYADQPEKAETVASLLTAASWIEKQLYPVNAKYHLSRFRGLNITPYCRTQDCHDLTPLFMDEVRQLEQLVTAFEKSGYIDI